VHSEQKSTITHLLIMTLIINIIFQSWHLFRYVSLSLSTMLFCFIFAISFLLDVGIIIFFSPYIRTCLHSLDGKSDRLLTLVFNIFFLYFIFSPSPTTKQPILARLEILLTMASFGLCNIHTRYTPRMGRKKE
jgi:hypothetical protein